MLAKLLFAAQAACCNRAEKKGDEKAKEKNNRQKQIQRPGQMQRRKNMLCQVRKELSLLNAADQMSQEIGSLKNRQRSTAAISIGSWQMEKLRIQ